MKRENTFQHGNLTFDFLEDRQFKQRFTVFFKLIFILHNLTVNPKVDPKGSMHLRSKIYSHEMLHREEAQELSY